MSKPLRRLFLLLAVVSGPALRAWGFGQNKVIVHNFRWRVAVTEHFEIHYTPESEPLLGRAAHYLEKAYATVTRDLGVDVKGRTPFFLLANHNEFEENNVVDVGEGTGGVTEAFKNRFVIFNDGTEFWMDHVITHEFTHVAEFEVLYGGFWKSARLLKSPLYPLWFMEGLAEYQTGDLDLAEEDMYIRDAALSDGLYGLGELHGFNHLKPHQVTLGYKQGGAAVRFLSEEYGRQAVPRLLKGMRERFEAGSLVAEITGQDFGDFNRRYVEHLTDRFTAQAARLNLEEPEAYGRRLTAPDPLPAFHAAPALTRDGARLAYMTDRGGPNEVALYDFASGRARPLAGRQWTRLENIHADGRALSFSPDGRWIAFVGEQRQRDYLYLYDTRRDRLRRVRVPFEQIRSPVFHPAGDRLVLVGMKGGTNDLYEVTPRGRLLRRLTDSPADESEPAYSPDGALLAYSVEVTSGPEPHRDLAALRPADPVPFPLTAMPGKETAPAFTPDGKSLLFVGEAMEGVRDLYRLDLAEGRAVQLTRSKGGTFAPAVAPDGGRTVFSAFRRGSRHLYAAAPEFWGLPPSTGAIVLAGQPSRLLGRGAPVASAAPTPAPSVAPFLAGADRPYRFRASTDLFFPLFYYSSTDGLFLATLWQASEYLGNHQLQGTVQYSSGNDFLDYQLQYTYRRFRPQFFLGTSGENFYRDFSKTELRREWDRRAGVAYPLDRFHRLEGILSSVHREDRVEGFPQFDAVERENSWALSFVRDTAAGRYLSVTSGTRLRLTYQRARPLFGATRDFSATSGEAHQFIPTGRESTLAVRGMAGVSVGPGPQLLRLGGNDRLRGYPRNGPENQAARYAFTNVEWRVPLKYLSSYTWFLFPDFSFKAVYGALFADTGYDWARSEDLRHLRATRARSAVGAGIRIPTFILQTYMVTISMDVAKRTDRDKWVWYFALGPEF